MAIRDAWINPAFNRRISKPGQDYFRVQSGGRDMIYVDTGFMRPPLQMINSGEIRGDVELEHKQLRNPFRMWVGLSGTCDWRSTLGFDLPEKLKPSPLNFLFLDLTGKNVTLDPGRVNFNAVDFDAF